ncbi:MAG: hypothetical protein ACWA41_05330 [Putridiphycobacter sp.]
MKRVQLFEFEDFDWFPETFRSTMTKMIIVFHKMVGTKAVITDLILKAKNKINFDTIVDLGSGSGGAMPGVMEELSILEEGKNLKMILTDLHPNQTIVNHINSEKNNYLTYHQTPVDATNLIKVPQGLKTMVNSFHHMPPNEAKKILDTAQKNSEPILIYEMGENFVPIIIWWLLLPLTLPILMLMAVLFLPFIKPITFKDVLFTWIIPIVPIFYAWDGQASGPRTYTFDDVKSILPPESDNFSWTIEKSTKKNGKKLGYYILGVPTES